MQCRERQKNSVDESYFFEDPNKLKEKYIKHLPAITVLSKRTKRRIKPAEVIRLEIENKKLKEEIMRLNDIILLSG